MGGRFGKYGDAKRKAQIRKNRLRPPERRQPKKDKPLKSSRKGKLLDRVQSDPHRSPIRIKASVPYAKCLKHGPWSKP